MCRVFKATVGLLMLLAMFVSANHCAFEELFSKCANPSNCCPLGDAQHKCGTPCKVLTAVEGKSFSSLARIEQKFSPLAYLAALSTQLLTGQVEGMPSIRPRLISEAEITLSANELVISPNAPPVA